jgi:hypothetical protein
LSADSSLRFPMKHQGQTTSEMMSMARGIVKFLERKRCGSDRSKNHTPVLARFHPPFRIVKNGSKSVVGAALFD